MDTKFTLWDAVEHNEQIELLLTRLEDSFKQLKQKGYKMNFNVSEKLKEIDKHINELLEEGKKEMKERSRKLDPVSHWYYKGFIVDIQPSLGLDFYIANCKELDFSLTTKEGIKYVLDSFEKVVDMKLDNQEESKEKINGIRTLNTSITYKGYELLVEVVHFIPEKSYNLEKRHIPSGYTTYGGKCEEISFVKGLCLELHELADEFKKAVNEELRQKKKESPSELSLTYKGYRMGIVSQIGYDKKIHFTGKCEIMNFDKSSTSIIYLINDFEETVDKILLINY